MMASCVLYALKTVVHGPGVPVSARIGGIWYRKDVLAKAGLEEPKDWQQLLNVAQKLNNRQ